MKNQPEMLAYFRYYGNAVENGILDIQKSIVALEGFDKISRYFIMEEEPSLRNLEFDIPIRIQQGSLEIIIPQAIDTLFSVKGVAISAGGIYATTLAKKAAEDGLFQTGPAKDIKIIIVSSFRAIEQVIKIAKHIGSVGNRYIKGKPYIEKGVPMIELTNNSKESLHITKLDFDKYLKCPKGLFSKSSKLISSDLELEVGYLEKDGKVFKSTILASEKSIFFDENDDIIFPELKHGDNVDLEGIITQLNEPANSMSFQYKGIKLYCKPFEGRLSKFKSKFVSKFPDKFWVYGKLNGVVDREDLDGSIRKKPFIDIVDFEPLREEATQGLFEESY